jgi:hypothetical protein
MQPAEPRLESPHELVVAQAELVSNNAATANIAIRIATFCFLRSIFRRFFILSTGLRWPAFRLSVTYA